MSKVFPKEKSLGTAVVDLVTNQVAPCRFRSTTKSVDEYLNRFSMVAMNSILIKEIKAEIDGGG